MEWKWTYASDAARGELGGAPERLMSGVSPLKENGVRCVYHVPGFFIKREHRRGRRLMREWESGRLLASLHVPCIEYLAHGSSAEGELLISREMAGAEQLDLYLERLSPLSPDTQELYRKIASFAGHLVDLCLWHPDFHAGNLLYSPASGELALVDVYGVRRRHFWDCFRGRKMVDVLACVPLSLPKDFHLELHRLAGAASPERSFSEWIKRRHRWLRHDWPKRKAQILTGYRKFTSVGGPWLLRRGLQWEQMLQSEHYDVTGSAQELEQQFLTGFCLELAGIPCRKVLGWNREENRLCLEPATPTEDEPLEAAWPLFYELLNGIPRKPGLCRDADGVRKIDTPFPKVTL